MDQLDNYLHAIGIDVDGMSQAEKMMLEEGFAPRIDSNPESAAYMSVVDWINIDDPDVIVTHSQAVDWWLEMQEMPPEWLRRIKKGESFQFTMGATKGWQVAREYESDDYLRGLIYGITRRMTGW